ncbi:MAG: universal stress protein [Micrococcales bacterium]|nr:universal stress protein [Micrococcales bacterium]
MDAKVEGIVVGYDGSEGAGVALDWASDKAKREGKPLTILHTLDMSTVPQFRAVPMTIDMTEIDGMENEFLQRGADRARKILGPEADIRPVRSIGSAAAELVAASKSADLVVTGSRGRGRLMGGLLGSTAYNVTAHSACPAVVVRSDGGVAPIHPGPDHRVVVAVDDSEPAGRALDEAARVAHDSGALLHIVTVAQVSLLAPWMTDGSPYDIRPDVGKEITEKARRLAEESLVSAVAHVADRYPDLDVDKDVLLGDTGGRAVADFGGDAGLIVVGARGRGGFLGMLLGSFSHSVIHYATCPVLVVR